MLAWGDPAEADELLAKHHLGNCLGVGALDEFTRPITLTGLRGLQYVTCVQISTHGAAQPWVVELSHRVLRFASAMWMLEPADVAWGIPGREPRTARPGHFHQTDYSVSMWHVRREQLEHSVVVDGATVQRPPDQPRNMQIADRNRIGIAQSSLCCLSCGPHPYARHGAQPLQCLRR